MRMLLKGVAMLSRRSCSVIPRTCYRNNLFRRSRVGVRPGFQSRRTQPVIRPRLLHQAATTTLHGSYSDSTGRAAKLSTVEAKGYALCQDSSAGSSSRTVSRLRALQQQIQPPHSVGLTGLDEEITDLLRRAENITL